MLRLLGRLPKLGTAARRNVGTGDAELPTNAQVVVPLPRSYLAGLGLSNGTDATNDIDIAVGEARNADNDGNLILTSVLIKQIDESWVPGSAGGLSSSLTLTNDTFYHVHLILVSGSVDVGFDTSVVAANLIADHSATKYRRIGSVRRGTAINLAFSQVGDEFLLHDPPPDFDSTIGLTASLITVTTPGGVKTAAILNGLVVKAGTTPLVYLSSPDVNDESPSTSGGPLGSIALASVDGREAIGGPFYIRTNTSSQFRARSSLATTTLRLVTLGWLDRRGRDD